MIEFHTDDRPHEECGVFGAYVPGREAAATVAVTTLVTGLAMNHVQRGSYLP